MFRFSLSAFLTDVQQWIENNETEEIWISDCSTQSTWKVAKMAEEKLLCLSIQARVPFSYLSARANRRLEISIN